VPTIQDRQNTLACIRLISITHLWPSLYNNFLWLRLIPFAINLKLSVDFVFTGTFRSVTFSGSANVAA
jgi:hypothetical protein